MESLPELNLLKGADAVGLLIGNAKGGTIHHRAEAHHRDVAHSVILAVSTVSRPIWDQRGSKFGIALWVYGSLLKRVRTGQGLDIIPADSKRSQEKKEWYTELAALKDSGWSLLFTDGTGGKNGEVAAAAVTHVTERGAYLGTLATVADGELKGITLALGSNADKLLVLTDSMASKQALLNLGKGAPPRSGIERELKDLLHKRAHLQTAIGWVRSHIGIPGNERADKRAAYESALGRIAGTQQVATAAGIRTAAKARRKDMRSEPGYGSNRCLWHRHALSAYTGLRTNRGPQNYWLHFVRKVDSPACPNCDHPSEDGHHITFDCPHHRQQRQELIEDARTWEDLDKPIWRKEEGEEEEWDAVEAYFAYLYRALAGR
ncbi:hypothetical protein EV426DRAFT_722189 [Tirmania nivea]|nr:hypothetical protein EV426DRAFT_722189 [Tirmania nivea]